MAAEADAVASVASAASDGMVLPAFSPAATVVATNTTIVTTIARYDQAHGGEARKANGMRMLESGQPQMTSARRLARTPFTLRTMRVSAKLDSKAAR